jgi:hypothetical protein
MMWNSFGRSLVFAAVAALGWWLLHPIGAACFGTSQAARLYLAFLLPLYVLGIGSDRGRALRASVAIGLGGAIIAMLPLHFGTTCVALASGLGVARSGWLHQSRPFRAWLVEVTLLGAGLGLASFLLQATTATLAYGIWGFFLVQSAFFLVGGVSARQPEPTRDAFEQARARLDALLS